MVNYAFFETEWKIIEPLCEASYKGNLHHLTTYCGQMISLFTAYLLLTVPNLATSHDFEKALILFSISREF